MSAADSICVGEGAKLERESFGARHPLANLFFFSTAMFTLPILAYYSVLATVERWSGDVTSSTEGGALSNGVLSAIVAAVFTVHAIIALYAWGAFCEVRREQKLAAQPSAEGVSGGARHVKND